MKTIIHIIKKEFLQFKRDPKMFGIVLIAPLVQLLFLGYAATMDVNNVHTLFYDQDKTEESRKFIEKFESSGFFQIDYYADSYEELTEQINNAKVLVGFVIPKDFSKKINRNETVKLQAIFDGSDGNTASIAAGYISKIIGDYSKNLIIDYREKKGIKVIPIGQISAEIRTWYNPYLKTRYFMVPAIVGLLLSIITLILTSLAVVKEKEIGTLDQIIVTPIKSFQLIIGKLVPFMLLGFVSVILVITMMRIIFDIPVRGSIIFLFMSSFFYILSTLGLGLFVSTISRTQQQAMMIAIFAILMPMVYLSGFAFPIENMPAILQYISYLIPLRYFITIIRGVVLKGIGFADLWQEALTLFIMGATILILSSLRFRKRLD
ncbi:MAG: ABC transporter permease [Ignavibacteriae bacterium]|nr:ABC transporter permease [Ignavibacteriota bacterium]MCB9209542.1 ABC transporter permease [Ignavibacteriales bacterium]